jgi:pyruvate/2-oxoglutarate dehydrogenase complex dihydrolipoamide acyltransferase (E2) component
MPVRVIMPHLGESVAEGTVLEWLKREGDPIQKDEPLLAISTEKVDAEVPAPADGILSRILVEAGAAAPVGSTLAEIEPRAEGRGPKTEPEAATAASSDLHSGMGRPQSGTLPPSKPAPGAATDAPGSPQFTPHPTSRVPHSKARFYSPAVLRLAEECNVDLEGLTGTGEGGRVSKRDVEMFLERRARPERAPVAVEEDAGEERVGLTKIRRAIAERMLRSVHSAPHATAVAEADFTAIARFRTERQAEFLRARGTKLTFLPFVVKAVAHVLPHYPLLNARWGDDAIYVRRGVHIGIAVALGEELAVPVLRAPASLPVSEIAERIGEMVQRARQGRLQPEEVTGSTFTVNNFGSDGTLLGTPILNPPEVGILGVGAIVKRPVVVSRDGEHVIAIRSVGHLCLSFDHRVVDGAMAGRFLQALRREVEGFNPDGGIWRS